MPTYRVFRGDAIPVAKVANVAPVGPIVAGQIFAVWCNGKAEHYTAVSGDSIDDVVAGLAAALAASTIPEFQEFLASPSADGTTLVVTAVTAGVPFDISVTCSGNLTVVETTPGHGGQNEVHKISLVGTYTGGNFTLTYNFGAGAVTTGTIAYNASASTVQTALAALSGVGAGNVLVTGGAGPANPWFVTWTGSLGNTSITPGTVNGASLTGGSTVQIVETQAGNGLSDEIQIIDLTPIVWQGSASTFNLSLDGQVTSQLNQNSTAAQIQTALQALPNVGSGNALVYGQSINNLEAQYYVVHFTGALAATNVSQLAIVNWVNLGAPSSTPIVTTVQDGGQTSSDDIQWIAMASNASQSVTLSYKGQSNGVTGTQWGNTSYGVQTNIQAISTVGSGNATVYLPAVTTMSGQIISAFLVRFTGAKANTTQSLFTVSGSSTGGTSTRLSIGHANVSEIQTIAIVATGGTFTLTAGAQTTSAIAYNASAATLKTRIQTDLSTTIPGCNTSGTGTLADPFVVTVTSPANTAIALLTANSASLTGGAGIITELVAGSSGANEVQTITLAAGVSGGTFLLSFGGKTTWPLPYNASAAQVQAALRSLATINTVTVSGSAGGPWTVTFSGGQANTIEPLIFADGSLLTGVTSPLITQSTSVFSAGPNHYDDPTNWTGGRIPDTGDYEIFESGDVSCLYGLSQIATFTVNATTDVVTFTGPCDLHNDQIVQVTSTTTLPGGLAAATNYYLVNVDRNAGTCQLATSSGGTAVNITDAGTGTHTIGVRLDYLEVNSLYTGLIGLARFNDAGYFEYRPRKLHIGLRAAGLQQVVIGPGDGSGSSRFNFDTDVDQVAIKQVNAGGTIESGVPPVLWNGSNAANTAEILNGDMGAALYAGEVATLAGFKIRAGSITLGAGTTVTGKIDQTGGKVKSKGATVNGACLLV